MNKRLGVKNSLIVAHDISFETRDDFFIFKNISIAFGREKSGLVGKNGAGKTTLIRLILGEIKPSSGKIEKAANIAYLPQDYQLNLDETVAESLGVSKKLDALEKIKNGESSDELLETVGQDWDIHDRVLLKFKTLGLEDISLDRVLGTLSGGERVKIVLAGLLIWKADFLILDEPTNNLDQNSRQSVYDLVRQWRGGILVISHDRTLLGLMDRIIELSDKGLKVYGGNYEMYEELKQSEELALQRQLAGAEQEFRKAKKQERDVKERQQKRSKHGKKIRDKLGLDKGILNEMKGNAQATAGKLKGVHEENIKEALGNLNKAREKISSKNVIEIDLSQTEVPRGKLVIRLENVDFSYSGSENLLFKDFNLMINGPERLVISGANGAGKTTLIKIMLGHLKPLKGEIVMGIEHCVYLDQNVSALDKSKTLLENLKMFSSWSEHENRRWLAKFLFYDEDAFKKVNVLSGGERMKAALACILSCETPPQLLILDEPTNNLDIDSTEQIESALSNFKGALIVVSHDKSFVKNIGIEKKIEL